MESSVSVTPQYPQAPEAPFGGPGYTNPPANPGTSGLAIAGFILAILIAPIGFILSIIGLTQTGKGKQKGRGLAISGIVISLLLMGGGVAAVFAIGKTVSTIADPGCTAGKAAIFDNSAKAADSATNKEGIQGMIAGLNAAAAKAKHDNVRAAMTTLSDDYTLLLKGMDSGNIPAGIVDKIGVDAAAIDTLCTIGAK